MSAPIDRCECSGWTFREIRDFAQQNKIKTVKGLKNRIPMGGYCSACAPYLHHMLKTGQTEFDEPIEIY